MNRKTQSAVDYMNANLHRRLPLIELASFVNISRAHLCRLFKTEVGVPPGQYLIMLRMQEAGRLFRSTFLSVKQVMARVGYADKGLFARHFKRTYGVTPLRYRAEEKRFDSIETITGSTGA